MTPVTPTDLPHNLASPAEQPCAQKTSVDQPRDENQHVPKTGAQKPRAALINLGCRVNRVELDVMASALESAGIELCAEEDAQVIVVNTCAVTGEAEAKTRKALRRAASLPQTPTVIATGCTANLVGEELLELAPHIQVETQKAEVPRRVMEVLGLPQGGISDEGVLIQAPTPTGRTRPGIKIQDGCDNRCSYCIVWKARGAGKSMPVEQVIAEVQQAISRGAQEIVLTGINLGSYQGVHAAATTGTVAAQTSSAVTVDLPDLLEMICATTTIKRIRISSIEPPDVTEKLLRVMAAHPQRIAPFLHMCLQSGSESVLARMKRIYTAAEYRAWATRAYELVDNLVLGTDLIVGFPGETDAEWAESLAFCREMNFANMHIFRYSKRPGTPAAEAPDQVDPHVMAARAQEARLAAQEMRRGWAQKLIGTTQQVVVEAQGRGTTGGLFDVVVPKDIPVDSFVEVLIQGEVKGRLIGQVVGEVQ